MFILRPVTMDDVNSLYSLASTSYLVSDKAFLQKRIENAGKSFANKQAIDFDKSFFWVLEDIAEQKIVGYIEVESGLSHKLPLINFRKEIQSYSAPALDIWRQSMILRPSSELSNSSVISHFYLAPSLRLSPVAAPYIKACLSCLSYYEKDLSASIFASLLSVPKSNEHLDFWSAVGKPFLNVSTQQACKIFVQNKESLSGCMPHHPIDTSLLKEKVRSLIGMVDAEQQWLYQHFLSVHFKSTNYVHFVDASPFLKIDMAEIKAQQQFNLMKVVLGKLTSPQNFYGISAVNNISGLSIILTNKAECRDSNVELDAKTLQLLQVENNDAVNVSIL